MGLNYFPPEIKSPCSGASYKWAMELQLHFIPAGGFSFGMTELSKTEEGVRASRLTEVPHRRLVRMRFVSRLLDSCIALPGGYRIGLDPIVGLVPAVGDFLAATLSIWIIYDAARLGISMRSLLRMGLNVLLDSVAGAVPVLGDLLDAVWKANIRNLQIVEAEYRPGIKERSFAGIAATLLGVLLTVWVALFGAIYLVVKGLIALANFF